ncbi:MAG: molybdopterin-binding protein [Planctomycetota bacterium]
MILTTGGLGPTADDLTRQAVAEAAGVGIAEDAQAWGVDRRLVQGFGPHATRSRTAARRWCRWGRAVVQPGGHRARTAHGTGRVHGVLFARASARSRADGARRTSNRGCARGRWAGAPSPRAGSTWGSLSESERRPRRGHASTATTIALWA